MVHLKGLIGDTIRDRCECACLTLPEEEIRKRVLRVFAGDPFHT